MPAGVVRYCIWQIHRGRMMGRHISDVCSELLCAHRQSGQDDAGCCMLNLNVQATSTRMAVRRFELLQHVLTLSLMSKPSRLCFWNLWDSARRNRPGPQPISTIRGRSGSANFSDQSWTCSCTCSSFLRGFKCCLTLTPSTCNAGMSEYSCSLLTEKSALARGAGCKL